MYLKLVKDRPARYEDRKSIKNSAERSTIGGFYDYCMYLPSALVLRLALGGGEVVSILKDTRD